MTEEKDNNKPELPDATVSKPDDDAASAEPTSAQDDWQITEDAIDEAIEEQQQEIMAVRAEQKASIDAEERMFDNMSLAETEEHDQGLPCLNCNTPLKGAYCYECGQPDRHFIRFFPRVLWDMINEAFDFDSKIFRTLMPLMFRPGKLSLEYIAGRRARYINPLRLYIVISLVFFLMLSMVARFSDEDTDFVKVNETGVKSRVLVTDDDGNELVEIGESEPESEAKSVRERNLESRLIQLRRAAEMGAPITEEEIEQIETELTEIRGRSAIRSINAETKDDMSVTFDDGTVWHPETNPVEFNNLFDAETTQDLNNFMWMLKNKVKMIEEDPKEFVLEVFDVFPVLMFFLLPIFAIILKFVYIFKKRYYMEHLVVALHSHSFIFFILLLIFGVDSMGEYVLGLYGADSYIAKSFDLLIVLLIIWLPINLFLQQKRVYAQGKFLSTVKFIFVGGIYFILLTFTALVSGVLGLANL
ncbi:MAG: DUF3667 domain-containing protein [Gammaproteobacteria bacterium]